MMRKVTWWALGGSHWHAHLYDDAWLIERLWLAPVAYSLNDEEGYLISLRCLSMAFLFIWRWWLLERSWLTTIAYSLNDEEGYLMSLGWFRWHAHLYDYAWLLEKPWLAHIAYLLNDEECYLISLRWLRLAFPFIWRRLLLSRDDTMRRRSWHEEWKL